jgi:hypothetical protein
MIKTIAALFTLLMFCGIAKSQDGLLVDNPKYGVKFFVPSSWKERKVEETSKSDAISYTFDKNDGSIAMMLIAFKLSEVKNLNDLVYTLEKDLTLNIPKIDGTYSEFDKGNYDGMSAKYKDTEFTEIIYYFRTKYSEGVNYAYMLRFIASTSVFNAKMDEEIRLIGDTFEPIAGQ